MGRQHIFVCALFLMLGGAWGDVLEGSYNVTAFCTMVKTGTKIGGTYSCSYYYQCTSNGPVNTTCIDTYAFDLSSQLCVPEGQVNCFYGLSDPCFGKTGANWVPIPGDCTGWVYCLGTNEAGRGHCPNGQSFNGNDQECVTGTCTNSGDSGIGNSCDVIPPGMYFGSTQDCSQWNYCDKSGILHQGNCDSTQNAFDVQKGQCGYESPSTCNRVTGLENGGGGSCSNENEVTPNTNICGSYYLCSGGTNLTQSCPTGQYYDVTQQSCVSRQAAIVTPGCNRCQYATTSWVSAAGSEGCQGYLYCNNGQGELEQCQYGMYFNEQQQGCLNTNGNPSLSTYASNNGACHGASFVSTTAGDSTDDSSTESTTVTTTTTDDDAGK